MKSKISVKLPGQDPRSYDVCVGAGVLEDLANDINFTAYSKVAVITDSNVASHCYSSFVKNLPIDPIKIVIAGGEPFKNQDTLGKIWQEMLDNKLAIF